MVKHGHLNMIMVMMIVVIQTAGLVDEIQNSCFYEIEIKTEFACQGWTTTTSIPNGECIFKSENGNHTFNMTSIRGKLFTQADEETGYLYYMYTPCANSAKCNNNISVMAYVFDGMNFVCKQYLAIWEDGYVEPNCIEGDRQYLMVDRQYLMLNGFVIKKLLHQELFKQKKLLHVFIKW
eukprot:321627_1